MTAAKLEDAIAQVDREHMKLQPGDVAGLRQLRWKRRLIVRQQRAVKASGRKKPAFGGGN